MKEYPWENIEKYRGYITPKQPQEDIIVDLDRKNWNLMKKPQSQRNGEHFIDRHKQALVERIKIPYPAVIDLYCSSPLTEDERDDILKISDTEDRMRCLYYIVRDWDVCEKQKVYQILYKYNRKVINDLKNLRKSSQLEECKTSEDSEMLLMSDNAMKEDDMGCKLCDKYQFNQDPVKVITPTKAGHNYLLSMTSPGLFRCSESDIQFRVTQPVTIEYEVGSWSNYTEILQNLRGGYEIIGPLFNIKSRVDPNIVTAVYLPHCLCLGGFKGDKSLIQCFHYKDDNLVLETPSRLEGKYAVLENPTFSCIGVILYPLSLLQEEIIKLKCYHGMVLLFSNTIIREDLRHQYRLHLYLLPSVRTVEKDVVLYEKRHLFHKIHKPPQIDVVYYKKKYRINGPLEARVFPRMLQYDSHSEIYPFTEIIIEGNRNTEVDVSILPEDEDVAVWESVVSAEEMLKFPSTGSQPGDCLPLPEQSDHFVVRHRAVLIRMISVVDPVLDDLLDQYLLTYEQYQTVRVQKTNEEKMRKLYDYIRAWGNNDKDKVYRSLREHNEPTIKTLENEFPADHNEPHRFHDAYVRLILYVIILIFLYNIISLISNHSHAHVTSTSKTSPEYTFSLPEIH
ncbi:NACHT, LRR and PYD domains-containing protein 1a-like isoform 1-T3 [Leptodactylus fuscus]|uniref:NACHT, LRR and PYD domains-containing protein 1a-like n=1 Tax=Leptodactylus fuscus TaxID=238119 RepID=UPI003F4F2CB0